MAVMAAEPVVLELRHVECESPAGYLPGLRAHAEVVTVRVGEEPLPDHREFAAVISMGGPMGVGDRGTFGWIDAELALLRAAVRAGIPVWGVCLGSQLLAAALGGEVTRGPVPEVGVLDVSLTPAGRADPLWGGLPPVFPALQWHGDTFSPPPGSELLASSRAYPNQLFRYGSSYGVQFHLEAGADLVGRWAEIPEYRESLRATLGPDGAGDLLGQVRAAEQAMTGWAARLADRWLAAHLAAGTRGA
jgi:GMP synthase (glutamine-hydrolysing)